MQQRQHRFVLRARAGRCIRRPIYDGLVYGLDALAIDQSTRLCGDDEANARVTFRLPHQVEIADLRLLDQLALEQRGDGEGDIIGLVRDTGFERGRDAPPSRANAVESKMRSRSVR